ncbi:MAG: GGDEF domain-containing protein [Pirellulaceae bacterium]
MIEILCTLTGIIAGVAVVASLFHYQGDRAQFQPKPQEVDSEKIRGIADQLQVISHRVAANVSAHSETVEHINGQLKAPGAAEPERILSTIQEIMRANEAMQGQLADAQKRIAQQSEMIEHASLQARTDALTGLANRRALDEFLSNCIAGSIENDAQLVGLLLMDIDHFKSFNDSFGHTTGDAVLASFARAIAKCCGQECYAARFGGEEFAVILTGNSVDDLAFKAAKIRHYVSEQIINYEDLQLKITASAGLCIVLADDTVSSAYERADEGLYQAKKSGRNCGFWLGNGAWTMFPDVSGEPSLPAAIRPSKATPQVDQPVPVTPANTRIDPAVTEEQADTSSTLSPAESAQSPEQPTSEILDLNAFLGRLDAYLAQLRRADLPAAAIMVEATGMEPSQIKDWQTVIGLVQLHLRGIDVVCQFRPLTLCVLMPGCSPDAALDRATKIQHEFHKLRASWPSDQGPKKLAIAIAGYKNGEEVAQFLDRLENTLEEAHDASDSEIVIHNGDSSHFQTV